MARNNYNNFSGYQFSPRSPFMGSDPLRNPYEEMGFRTPHGFPPRPRESPTGFSPRQQFSSSRLKRPFPQNSADSPNRSPYGGNSFFHQGTSTPYNANASFQCSPNFSPRSTSSSFQQSPNTTSSPSHGSRNSSGPGNRSFSSPRNSYQRQNHRDCNPGGSTDVQDYYHPSIVSDPWQNLRPSRTAPLKTKYH